MYGEQGGEYAFSYQGLKRGSPEIWHVLLDLLDAMFVRGLAFIE